MAEFRLQVPDSLVQAMQDKMGEGTKMTDIAREALTMFNWALNEKANGRVILSSSSDGGELKQLAMASLDKVQEKAGT